MRPIITDRSLRPTGLPPVPPLPRGLPSLPPRPAPAAVAPWRCQCRRCATSRWRGRAAVGICDRAKSPSESVTQCHINLKAWVPRHHHSGCLPVFPAPLTRWVPVDHWHCQCANGQTVRWDVVCGAVGPLASASDVCVTQYTVQVRYRAGGLGGLAASHVGVCLCPLSGSPSHGLVERGVFFVFFGWLGPRPPIILALWVRCTGALHLRQGCTNVNYSDYGTVNYSDYGSVHQT